MIPSNKVGVFMTLVVLVILIGFPLGALYMSRSGLVAYKAILAEMTAIKDSVQIPNFDLVSQNGVIMNKELLEEKVIIAHFFEPEKLDSHSQTWSELKRIQAEFLKKSQKRIQILSFSLRPDSVASLQILTQKTGIDTLNWNLVAANDSNFVAQLMENGFKINRGDAPYTVALVDTRGFICNYYDLRSPDVVNKMMMHMSIVIPAKKDRKKIKFEREKEVYK